MTLNEKFRIYATFEEAASISAMDRHLDSRLSTDQILTFSDGELAEDLI